MWTLVSTTETLVTKPHRIPVTVSTQGTRAAFQHDAIRGKVRIRWNAMHDTKKVSAERGMRWHGSEIASERTCAREIAETMKTAGGCHKPTVDMQRREMGGTMLPDLNMITLTDTAVTGVRPIELKGMARPTILMAETTVSPMTTLTAIASGMGSCGGRSGTTAGDTNAITIGTAACVGSQALAFMSTRMVPEISPLVEDSIRVRQICEPTMGTMIAETAGSAGQLGWASGSLTRRRPQLPLARLH